MSETRKPLYSPVQVAMSVLLGGPLAGTHLFWSNFISLGMAKEAKRALFIGLAATIGIYVWIIFTPKKAVPGALITLLVGLTFRFLVETYQLKNEAIKKSRLIIHFNQTGKLCS